MSYIIYGGLFDPVHLGHIVIAREAYRKINPKKIIWIPSAAPPHRKVDGIPARQRKKMLEHLFRDIGEYEVSSVELDKEHSGYTSETIKIFSRRYPQEKIYLLIGIDEAINFKKWKNWEYILKKVSLIIGKRDNINGSIPDEVKSGAVILDNPLVDISSSWLRERLKEGKSVEKYLPDNLDEYIKERGLYI